MRVVIADTGPVNYLTLIQHIDLLPRMFERVVLPGPFNPNSPVSRRRRLFSAGLPLLQLGLRSSKAQGVDPAAGLHQGEAAAIALAVSLHADLLLMERT